MGNLVQLLHPTPPCTDRTIDLDRSLVLDSLLQSRSTFYMLACLLKCCVILDYSYQSKTNQPVVFGSPPIFFAARRLSAPARCACMPACIFTMQLMSVCNCSSTSDISESYYSLAVVSPSCTSLTPNAEAV